jgi:hypothetical protein
MVFLLPSFNEALGSGELIGLRPRCGLAVVALSIMFPVVLVLSIMFGKKGVLLCFNSWIMRVAFVDVALVVADGVVILFKPLFNAKLLLGDEEAGLVLLFS